MAEGILWQFGLYAALFHYDVVARVLSLGHQLVGDVGDGHQHGGQLPLRLLHLLLQALLLRLQRGHLLLYLFSLVFLALLHQSTDGLGHLVALLLVGIQFLLGFPTTLVYLQDLVYRFLGTGEVFLLQSFYHTFRLFCDKFKC